MTDNTVLYVLGTVLQVTAYLRGDVSFTVICWANVAYSIALWVAWRAGSLQ